MLYVVMDGWMMFDMMVPGLKVFNRGFVVFIMDKNGLGIDKWSS